MTEAEAKQMLELASRYEFEIDSTRRHIELLSRMTDIYDTSPRIAQLEEYIKKLTHDQMAVSRAVSRLGDQVARIIFTRKYLVGEKWRDVMKYTGRMTERNARYIKEASMPEFVRLLSEEMEKN